MQALEEVDKNLVAMKHMLLGEGDAEPNPEQVSLLTVEACKDDFLELLVQKLPSLGWDVRFLSSFLVFFLLPVAQCIPFSSTLPWCDLREIIIF